MIDRLSMDSRGYGSGQTFLISAILFFQPFLSTGLSASGPVGVFVDDQRTGRKVCCVVVILLGEEMYERVNLEI